MPTPNSQLVHARECVGSVEDSIHRMEKTITRRLMAGWEIAAEEGHLRVRHSKLEKFRGKLEDLKARCSLD